VNYVTAPSRGIWQCLLWLERGTRIPPTVPVIIEQSPPSSELKEDGGVFCLALNQHPAFARSGFEPATNSVVGGTGLAPTSRSFGLFKIANARGTIEPWRQAHAQAAAVAGPVGCCPMGAGHSPCLEGEDEQEHASLKRFGQPARPL
jgi:hypothetical protein